MSKLKILMIIAVVLSLGAGILLGFAGSRMPFHDHHGGHSFLMDELNLTEDQRNQMQKIWSDTVDGLRDKHFQQMDQMRQDREAAIDALLTPDQKTKYDAMNKDFQAKMAVIDKERDDSIQSAIDQTKKILTDSQRAKYEQLLKDHPMPGGPGDHGPSGHGPGGHGPGEHGPGEHGGPGDHGGPPGPPPDAGFSPPPTSQP
jgi:Spy/CpxP family protein refolding chaperone